MLSYPEKKACVTCVHFKKEYDGKGIDAPYNDSWVDLVCHAKEQCLDKLQNNCDLHELIDKREG